MKKNKISSIISLQDYKKQKAKAMEKYKKVSKEIKSNNSPKKNQNSQTQIFYMSNYLKLKKIPDLKNIQKSTPIKEEPVKKDNLISLDQYRKEKQEKKVWKKEFQFYTKEALSVSGMTFLFLFMFNLMSSIPSNYQPGLVSGEQTIVARGNRESGERLKESLGLETEGSRKTASQTNKNLLKSHREWTKKLKSTNKKNIIFGEKPISSDYKGF